LRKAIWRIELLVAGFPFEPSEDSATIWRSAHTGSCMSSMVECPHSSMKESFVWLQ
jgi:hypothetical protein